MSRKIYNRLRLWPLAGWTNPPWLWSQGACSRASDALEGRAVTAGWARSDPTPGSGFSHRHIKPTPVGADSGTARRCRAPFLQTSDHSTTSTAPHGAAARHTSARLRGSASVSRRDAGPGCGRSNAWRPEGASLTCYPESFVPVPVFVRAGIVCVFAVAESHRARSGRTQFAWRSPWDETSPFDPQFGYSRFPRKPAE